MNVLVLDRAAVNGYSRGLVAALQDLGVDALLGTAAHAGVPGAVAVYPRAAVAGQRLAKLGDLLAGLVRLLWCTRRLRPAIVHVQWPSRLDVFLMRIVAALAGSEVVYTAHNPVARLDEGSACQDSLLERTRAVFVHGDSLANQLRQDHPALKASVHVIPIGNYEGRIERFDRDVARRELLIDGAPLFAFFGQVRPYKGIETLIRAYEIYRLRGGRGALVVAGRISDVAYGAEIRALAEAARVPVHWRVARDQLPQRDLDLVISAANQVVLPFHDATQSASVVLAMTHGRCVVTTKAGAIREAVGQNGLLVDPRDASGLADAMRLADDDPIACDRIGLAARAHVLAEFSWSRAAALTREVYISVTLAGTGGQAHEGWPHVSDQPSGLGRS